MGKLENRKTAGKDEVTGEMRRRSITRLAGHAAPYSRSGEIIKGEYKAKYNRNI